MNEVSFWAKTSNGKPGISVYEHMLNVGSVALALSETMPFLLDNFGLCANDVATLVALHDLGKISPGFQRKCTAWLVENGFEAQDCNCGYREELEGNHAKTTHLAIHKTLADMRITSKVAGFLSALLGAHHGKIQYYPDRIDKRGISKLQQKKYYGIDWVSEWRAHTDKIMDYFHANLSSIQLSEDSPELWFLAGLTTIADWIGSDENFFPPEGANWCSEEHIIHAKNAIRRLGFKQLQICDGLSFSQMFDFCDSCHPNDIQLKAKECIKDAGVYVIEAPMGMGKTEAALWVAYNLLAEGKASGIYFALPTQATSNRMHMRMKKFVEKIAPDCISTRLIHANSWLFADDYPKLSVNETQEDMGAIRDWFSGARRALIAPFGLGTIDQALLGILAVKHFFIRHFALAGKVVILDEVHSYDIYTGSLIAKLVETLKNLGCTVIILSATLTNERRNKLLQSATIITDNSYPIITGFSKQEPGNPKIAKCEKPKTKTIDATFENEKQSCGIAFNTARNGGVVLWVCNTVKSSQDHYAKICAEANGGFLVGLLHSHFPFWRREELEDEWMSRLGKESRGRRGCILVSTQIVEQSVDLDADLLITELAPTDMLFQRIGRLWRHDRENRIGSPRMIILEEKHSLKEYKIMSKDQIYDSLGPKARVYFPDVLLTSLDVWQVKQKPIKIPEDVRPMLESTYHCEKQMPKIWEELIMVREGKEAAQKSLADQNSRYWQPLLPDEEGIQTRLNEVPTVPLILCRQDKNDKVILLNFDEIVIEKNRFDLACAKSLHKNIVKMPYKYFNNCSPPDLRFRDYLSGAYFLGTVGDNNTIHIDGLKSGTTLQWNNDEGVKAIKMGNPE